MCLRLWQSADPEAMLDGRACKGCSRTSSARRSTRSRPTARRCIALLGQMVTSGGTRNVVSAEDLRQRVARRGRGYPPELVDEALDRLERESKLVRRERRRDIYLYEITSEFSSPGSAGAATRCGSRRSAGETSS